MAHLLGHLRRICFKGFCTAPSNNNRYVDLADRHEFFRQLVRVVERIPITHIVHACRDPKDDKFLELAVNGNANMIVTGDQDLLVLSPFKKIPIITPASYLERPA